MAGIGPAPKPPSKRRHRGTPKSYGAAVPTTAPAAPDIGRELGLDDPHELITSLWDTVATSCESRFFSEADWARLRCELWFADTVLKSESPTAASWRMVQRGLNDLLISPAEKRRVAIELRPPNPDSENARVISMIDGYREKLKPVT
jgi:hypothetical protein